MEAAFNAGMERAAEMVDNSTAHNSYISEAIRKEIK
jgi:hypothetical protein